MSFIQVRLEILSQSSQWNMTFRKSEVNQEIAIAKSDSAAVSANA